MLQDLVHGPLTGESTISGLARAIQLALAPVFLLSGIGAFLAVLTNRLARVIDRARTIEELLATPSPIGERHRTELGYLRLRIGLTHSAITFCTYAALLVAGVVAALFVGALTTVDLAPVVAVIFILAMAALIAGLTSFLREIHVATHHFRLVGMGAPGEPVGTSGPPRDLP
jgi:hypothetical protein